MTTIIDEIENVEDPTEGTIDRDLSSGANAPLAPDAEPEEEASEDEGEPDTFPRAYVEKLRKENADNRAKVKDRDALAERLHVAQVAALGRLADPTDLPYAEDLLDPDKLAEAVDELLARKPHLANRQPRGDIGQGASGGNGGAVDLLGMLRERA